MKLSILGALGDNVCLTAVVRGLKEVVPDEIIRIKCKSRFVDVWKNNPRINCGVSDSGEEVEFNYHPERNGPTLPDSLAKQVGIRLKKSEPELFLDKDEIGKSEAVLQNLRRPILIISTRASKAHRIWLQEGYQEVVNQLRDKWSIVEVGRSGAMDVWGRRVEDLKGTHLDLVEKLELREVIALISSADLYLGSDSGLSHVAAAVGTPQVTIYSSTPPQYRAYRSTIPVWGMEKECDTPCNKGCPKLDSGDFCMTKVSVEEVLGAVERASVL